MAETCHTTASATPQSEARLNPSATEIKIVVSTSSRSPPMIWFGLFADW